MGLRNGWWVALLASFLLGGVGPARANDLPEWPAERLLAWNPGMPGGIPDAPVVFNVRDFGAVGDGITDDSRAFFMAIARMVEGGALEIPPGTYILRQQLLLRTGIVLRGAGREQTTLIFDLNGKGDHSILGEPALRPNTWYHIRAGIAAGATSLEIENASDFEPGDFVEIVQDNDAVRMYTRPFWNQPWAVHSVGQIMRVRAVEGDRLQFSEPVLLDYNASLNPRLRHANMVQNVGVEGLTLERRDFAEASMIFYWYCAYCWVRDVESRYATRTHVTIQTSYRNVVRDSYFHHARSYGGGGYGYGVVLQHRATHNLVENNVFHTLRHAMMVKTGAIANVFGYNYSFNSVSDLGPIPDISLHGHYPSYNLFEGNVVAEIYSADYWGPSGPGNTFFRNRLTGAPERDGHITIGDASHQQNIIGNWLDQGMIVIHADVYDTFIQGNHTPYEGFDPATPALPASLYLRSRPPFYQSYPYPSLGGDSPEGLNPATIEYLQRIRSGDE